MGMVYDRIESDEHVIIRFSRYLISLVGVVVVYAVLTLLIRNVWLAVFVSLLMVFFISRDMRPIRAELVAAQEAGLLTKSGRRSSFRNPLTYYIKKQPTKGKRKGKRSA